MRLVREITAEEENFRFWEAGTGPSGQRYSLIRRDPVEPEPVGTLVLMAFRITGYDRDCDGGLMARLEQVEIENPKENTGWDVDHVGLYPETGIVVTDEELAGMHKKMKREPAPEVMLVTKDGGAWRFELAGFGHSKNSPTIWTDGTPVDVDLTYRELLVQLNLFRDDENA